MDKEKIQEQLTGQLFDGLIELMNASTEPVKASYWGNDVSGHAFILEPEGVCELSLVTMTKQAWANLGPQIASSTAVGVFCEINGILQVAVLDGELVIIRPIIASYMSDLERIRDKTYSYSKPSWHNAKNGKQLALAIILKCLFKYSKNELVRRVFLPWGSAPLPNVKEI